MLFHDTAAEVHLFDQLWSSAWLVIISAVDRLFSTLLVATAAKVVIFEVNYLPSMFQGHLRYPVNGRPGGLMVTSKSAKQTREFEAPWGETFANLRGESDNTT